MRAFRSTRPASRSFGACSCGTLTNGPFGVLFTGWTLRTVATQSAPGSTLVMDYAPASAIELMRQNPDMPVIKQLAQWGEPWVFGVPDGQEREFFVGLGLEPVQMFAVFKPETIARFRPRTAPISTRRPSANKPNS